MRPTFQRGNTRLLYCRRLQAKNAAGIPRNKLTGVATTRTEAANPSKSGKVLPPVTKANTPANANAKNARLPSQGNHASLMNFMTMFT